jgi:hypothetical protein
VSASVPRREEPREGAAILERRRLLQIAARVCAWSTLATIVLVVMAPWLKDLTTFGFHDWDVQTSHRYLAVRSLLHFHELPGWNPYACGGYPAWGYVESATIVVSPWLPFYLLLPMAAALRVEVLGQALLGAAGAYALAGTATRSHAARALVAALWAVNGRFGLQTAAGHTWHLAYAWTPWCLLFFERARARGASAWSLAAASGAVAMLVYAGGIYPLPHTAMLLALYALLVAAAERSARPLTTLAAVGSLGVALAAPKLLPMIDTFRKSPRLIESKETLDLGALVVMLTSRDQGFGSRPARVAPYGWHEWGIYVGVAGLAVMVAGVLFARGRREAIWKALGAYYLVLGFGAFHPMAPWTLLHEYVPAFQSQHVPSRFLYTAVLLFALVAAAGLGRLVERASLRLPWIDLAACLLVLGIGVDVALVAQKPMAAAMWMVPPPIPAGRTFHFEKRPPFQYVKRDWAGPMYLAMLGETGVLDCYGAPPFERRGALAKDDPRYRGEVFVEGEGEARLASWTPNEAVIDVRGASPGSRVVYNMNYDEGWSAEVEGGGGELAMSPENRENVLAVGVPAGDARVRLSYSPPWLVAGLALAGAAGVALGAAILRERGRRRGDEVDA